MTTAAAAATPPPARVRRREAFECVDCGHTFRSRTKAGIHARCPECGGVGLGGPLKARLIAAAAQRVRVVATDREHRSHKRKTAAVESAPPAATASALVAETHPAPSPPAPPTRRPRVVPIIESLTEPPAPKPKRPRAPARGELVPAAHPDPSPAPAVTPRRPGLFDRILGVES